MIVIMTFCMQAYANSDSWTVVNRFGKSTVLVNESSIRRIGDNVYASVKYVLIPQAVDKRNGKDIKEMRLSEEYDLAASRFRVRQIMFVYADGSPDTLLNSPENWNPATGGNHETMEFLRAFGNKEAK